MPLLLCLCEWRLCLCMCQVCRRVSCQRLLCVIAVCATKNGKWMVMVGGGWCGGDH